MSDHKDDGMKKKRASHAFDFVCRHTVFFLFGLVLVYLLILAGFSTSIVDYNEHVYLIKDNVLINLAFSCIIIALLFLSKKSVRIREFAKKINEDPSYSRRCRLILILIIGGVSFFYIILCQNKAVNDQRFLLEVAEAWEDKDFKHMLPGGYADLYPNQHGMIIILYLLQLIEGAENEIMFQLINVISLCMLYKTFADISDLTGEDRLCGLMIIAAGLLFSPAVLYTTYIYGILPGFYLAAEAIRQVLLFEKEHRIKQIVLMAVCVFFSVLFKSNYQIFFIALLIYVVLRGISGRDLRLFLTVIPIIASLLLTGPAARGTVYLITGKLPGDGFSKWSWLAMGLQENDEAHDGWWNAYNWITYEEAGFDTQKQTDVCKDYVKERIHEFLNDPQYAVGFFAGKEASQWNNPEFQGIWINRIMRHGARIPRWLNHYSDSGADRFIKILNLYQFLILTGSVIYVCFVKKKNDLTFLFGTIFLGGFLFHTFWEAKAQYALTYFMLLIPVFSFGIYAFLKQGIPINKDHAGESVKARDICLSGMIGLVMILTATGLITPLNGLFRKQSDTEAYQRLLAENGYVRMKDGEYMILPVSGGEDIGISEEPVKLSFSLLDNGCRIRTGTYDLQVGYMMQGSDDAKRYLLIDNGTNDDNGYKWLIRNAAEKGNYYILSNDGAYLGCNEESRCLFLTPDTSEAVVWTIERHR